MAGHPQICDRCIGVSISLNMVEQSCIVTVGMAWYEQDLSIDDW